MEKRWISRIAPYLFLVPSFTVYFFFILLPLLQTVLYSFTNFDLFTYKWTGLRNYQNLFKDAVFLKSVGNTLYYSLVLVAVSLTGGILMAVLLNERWMPGKTLFRSILYMPNIISIVAASMVWVYIYNGQHGILNSVLSSFGLPTANWLYEEAYAMPSLILVAIWQLMGYDMIVYLAGLQGIPAFLYEASTIDGASRVQQFFKITLPMVAPTTFFLTVLNIISSFQAFGQIYIMTGGGPLNSTTTIVHQIYRRAFTGYKMGYASAMAVVLLMMSLLVTFLLMLRNKQKGEAEFD